MKYIIEVSDTLVRIVPNHLSINETVFLSILAIAVAIVVVTAINS